MTLNRKNGLGASPVGRVTWKGSEKSTGRAGTILNEAALASREKRSLGRIPQPGFPAAASGGDERVEIDSGADLLGSIPIDPLEPRGRGWWRGWSEGTGVAGSTL